MPGFRLLWQIKPTAAVTSSRTSCKQFSEAERVKSIEALPFCQRHLIRGASGAAAAQLCKLSSFYFLDVFTLSYLICCFSSLSLKIGNLKIIIKF